MGTDSDEKGPLCWHGPECSGTGPDCAADKPWCQGGPPRSLLDAVRSVMQPGGGLDRPRSMTPGEVLDEVQERFGFPLCTVIDVADEMRGFYG